MKNSKSKKEKERDTKSIQDIRTMFSKKSANTKSTPNKLNQSKEDIKMDELKHETNILLESNKKTRKAHELSEDEGNTKHEKAPTKQVKIETKKDPKSKAKVKDVIISKKKADSESESEPEAAEGRKTKAKTKSDKSKSKSKSPARKASTDKNKKQAANKDKKNEKAKNKKKSKNEQDEKSFIADKESEEDSDFSAGDFAESQSDEDFSADLESEEAGIKNAKKGKQANKKDNKVQKLQITPVKADKPKQWNNDLKIESAKKNLNNKNNKDNDNDKKDESLIDLDEDEMKAIEFAFAEMEKEQENEKKSLRRTKNNVSANVNNNIAMESKEHLKDNRNLRFSSTHKKGNKVIMDDSFEEEEELSNLSGKKTKQSKKTAAASKKALATNKKGKADSANLDSMSGPLTGITIVITGVTRVDRDELSNILKGFGAKVTGSVSKKTTYLLAGDVLEDGRAVMESSKYRKASELKTKIINFDELQEILRERANDPDLDLENMNWKNSKPLEVLKKAEESLEANNKNFNSNANRNFGFLKPAGADNNNVNIIDKNLNVSDKMDIDEAAGVSKKDSGSVITPKINKSEDGSADLWTTKYIPKSTREIIGNQSNVSKIAEWLEDWHDVNILGKNKEAQTSKNPRYKNENPNAKALLISGDPGIGKTSTVRLLGKILGFKLFELNASDQRSKKIILSKVGYLTDSTTLESKKDEKINQKNLILMDEIDGMAGNEDRGGVAALIQIIKTTKTPIICICNDRQSQKLKSLTNYCFDVKFSKPDKRQVTKRLVEICNLEGLKVEENAIENLCESVGNDIRQCLNFLQFWSRKFSELKFFDMKNHFGKFNKDSAVMINHFDGVTRLLTRASFAKMGFRDKLNMFFLDYDLVPLLVQENYLSCFKDSKPQTLEKMFKSADHISFSDILDKRIRSQNDWNLLQDKGIHSSVAVGQYAANFIGFPKFPELFGKMSTQKKVKRQIKELKYNFYGLSQFAIKEEVCPLVLSYVSNNLVEDGKEGIDKSIEFLKEYRIPLEKFKENIMDLQTKESILKKYEKLDTRIKSAFTKKYNAVNKTSIKRKKTKMPGEVQVKYDADGNVIEEILSEDEDDLESNESIVSVNGPKGKKK